MLNLEQVVNIALVTQDKWCNLKFQRVGQRGCSMMFETTLKGTYALFPVINCTLL